MLFLIKNLARCRRAIAVLSCLPSPVIITNSPSKGLKKKGLRKITYQARKWNRITPVMGYITPDQNIKEIVNPVIVSSNTSILTTQ